MAGLSIYERLEGSASSLGLITKLDNSVGYSPSSHFSISAGIPVYFVRPSASTTSTVGAQAANGIGNVYGQFRLSAPGSVVSFASTLTATAPTGNKALGFSTGHATVDWSNYLERSSCRLTPFGEIGLANAVSDTLFFVRPYVSQGFVVHGQAGARYQVSRAVSVGGSYYFVAPSGQQTVISRVSPAADHSASGTMGTPGMGTPPGNSNGNSNGRGKPVFETSATTTGPADIARDRGFSTWFKFSIARPLDLYGGFTRSTEFAYNTAFFGIGVSVGDLFGHAR